MEARIKGLVSGGYVQQDTPRTTSLLLDFLLLPILT